MHWGHARSRDLVHGETLPLAIAPAHDLGALSCFSGNLAWDQQGEPVQDWVYLSSPNEPVRYAVGDFDPEQCRFVPRTEGRLNHDLGYHGSTAYRDTPGGRVADLGVEVSAEGGSAELPSLDAWRLAPARIDHGRLVVGK